jgi:hypothetical protein
MLVDRLKNIPSHVARTSLISSNMKAVSQGEFANMFLNADILRFLDLCKLLNHEN